MIFVAVAVAAAPVNDTFPGTTISGASGTLAGTTVEATKETGEPNNNQIPEADFVTESDLGGVSVWYTWTAPSSGTFHICVVPGIDEFNPDTTLGVWTGLAVDSLTEVAFNDDTTGLRRGSWVMFGATSGTTYRIGVGGYGGDTGPFTLEWGTTDCVPPQTFISSPKVRGKRFSADFSATENVAGTVTFECSLDGGPFTACTSPFLYTAPGRGTHTLEVQATDAASNVDPSPATFTFETHGPPVP